MASIEKPCKKCGIVFIGKYCKPCANLRSAERRKANPQKSYAAVAEWKKKNKERVSELNKQSYQRMKKEIAVRAKDYRKKNRAKLDAYNQAYNLAHPEQWRKRMRDHDKKAVAEITDRYLKSVMRLHGVEVPKAFLDVARISLAIKREIRKHLKKPKED